jgi:hypothetical protein
VALAIVSTAVVWTTLEYMMPAANQAFRVMAGISSG